MTAQCADVWCWSARAEKSGKPMTTPPPTIAIRAHRRRGGTASRRMPRAASASAAATTARPRPTTVPSSWPTAMRVAGKVKLNPSTPSAPSKNPSAARPLESDHG